MSLSDAGSIVASLISTHSLFDFFISFPIKMLLESEKSNTSYIYYPCFFPTLNLWNSSNDFIFDTDDTVKLSGKFFFISFPIKILLESEKSNTSYIYYPCFFPTLNLWNSSNDFIFDTDDTVKLSGKFFFISFPIKMLLESEKNNTSYIYYPCFFPTLNLWNSSNDFIFDTDDTVKLSGKVFLCFNWKKYVSNNIFKLDLTTQHHSKCGLTRLSFVLHTLPPFHSSIPINTHISSLISHKILSFLHLTAPK
jgi:hypothetical protein